ncbi:MAG: hypothetical protein J0M34_02875 [Alphaproteobacteria bacterium]|nr:hypothetical protein [Alphaproteobacteria bacterium]
MPQASWVERELDIAMTPRQCDIRADELRRYIAEHRISKDFPNAAAVIEHLASELNRGGISSCKELQDMMLELEEEHLDALSVEDIAHIHGAVKDTVDRYLDRNNRDFRHEGIERIMDTPLQPEQREELLSRIEAIIENNVYKRMSHEPKQAVARAWNLASKTSYFDTPRELEQLICTGYCNTDGEITNLYEDIDLEKLEPLDAVQRTIRRYVQDVLRNEQQTTTARQH